MGDLDAADRLPVAEHDVEVGIAVDVVVVARADRGRQMRLGIEQDREVRCRRWHIATASIGVLPSSSLASGRTFFGASSALSSSVGETRSSSRSAVATRMPDIGWLAPLSLTTIAERRPHDLGVLDLLDCRIFHARGPRRCAPAPLARSQVIVIVRIAEEARLAAGNARTARAPNAARAAVIADRLERCAARSRRPAPRPPA